MPKITMDKICIFKFHHVRNLNLRNVCVRKNPLSGSFSLEKPVIKTKCLLTKQGGLGKNAML